MTPDEDDGEDRPLVTRTDIHLIIAIFLGSLMAVQAWDIIHLDDGAGGSQPAWSRLAQTFEASPTGTESTSEIASILFADWAFPFEVLSLLLLVALVGALAVAMRDRERGGGR